MHSAWRPKRPSAFSMSVTSRAVAFLGTFTKQSQVFIVLLLCVCVFASGVLLVPPLLCYCLVYSWWFHSICTVLCSSSPWIFGVKGFIWKSHSSSKTLTLIEELGCHPGKKQNKTKKNSSGLIDLESILLPKQEKETCMFGSAYEDAVGGTILSKQVLNGCPRIKLGLQSLALWIIWNKITKTLCFQPIYKSTDPLEESSTIYLLLLQFGKSSSLLAVLCILLYCVVTVNS